MSFNGQVNSAILVKSFIGNLQFSLGLGKLVFTTLPVKAPGSVSFMALNVSVSRWKS